MKKERISIYQLFALIILFEIGSTTLFALGIDAKQDAWMVVLIALVVGLGLLWVFTEIQGHYPNQNFAEILISVLGKWLAIPLIMLYALSFFWTASFNVYEFSQSNNIYFLSDTPLSAIIFLFLILMTYSLFLGVEVIGRSAEIFLPWFLGFLICIFIFIAFSDEIKIERLFPVLENGIIPVVKTTPQIVNFPFGEMNVFLMYWCYVNDKQTIRKTSMLAMGISGFVLMLSLISMITVLGVNTTSIAAFPLLDVIRKIRLGEFIQRIDVIGGGVLLIGGFYKGILYFNGSCLAIQTLLNPKPKNQKWLIIIMIVALFVYIHIYFTNFNFYRWAGLEVNTKMVYPLFQVIIPILVLFIIKIKAKLYNM